MILHKKQLREIIEAGIVSCPVQEQEEQEWEENMI